MADYTIFDEAEQATIRAIATTVSGGMQGVAAQVAKGNSEMAGLRNAHNEAFIGARIKKAAGDTFAGLRKVGGGAVRGIYGAAVATAISAVPPEISRLGLSAYAGFQLGGGGLAGAAGAGVGLIGAAGAIYFEKVQKQVEEQQKALTKARGFETKRAQIQRISLQREFSFANYVEQVMVAKEEFITKPFAGEVSKLEALTPSAQAELIKAQVIAAIVQAPLDLVANGLGSLPKLKVSAEDFAPNLPWMRLNREDEIGKWAQDRPNAHPTASWAMNEMRRRVDIQLSGKGVAGGWKNEPPSGD